MDGIIKGYNPSTGIGFMAVGSERILFEKNAITFATKDPAIGVKASFDITGVGDGRRAVSIILDDCEEPEQFIRVGRERFLPSQIRHYGIRNCSREYLETIAARRKAGKRDPIEQQLHDLMIASPNFTLAQEGTLECLCVDTKDGKAHQFYETEFDIFTALDTLDETLSNSKK